MKEKLWRGFDEFVYGIGMERVANVGMELKRITELGCEFFGPFFIRSNQRIIIPPQRRLNLVGME